MICVTSISPTHINKDIQLQAVKSWQDLGINVYSFNSPKEVEILKPLYPSVTFVETTRTMELTYGKPYVQINAILDFCQLLREDYFCIINSDIELKTDKQTIDRIKIEMEKGIVLSNRVNYDVDYNGAQYMAGIDTFFIHKKWMAMYAQTTFCFGQCFWDYWIPYVALMNNIPVTFIKQNVTFHKNHHAQYNADQWKKTGRYFIWEHNLYQFNPITDIGKMSTYVFNYIYSTAKRIEI